MVQIALPTGRFAYGRVLRDAGLAVYRCISDAPGNPPIGSRDYMFVVGVYSDVPGSPACPIVAYDPSTTPDDDWPPPMSVTNPISGATQLYHRGKMRPATPAECEGLEPAAAWDLHHIVDRIVGASQDQRQPR